MGDEKLKTVSVWHRWFGDASYQTHSVGELVPGKCLDLNFEHGGHKYIIILRAQGDGSEWRGTLFTDGVATTVRAQLYTAKNGSMILVGSWEEQGLYTWVALISD
jgi:hypothetical protein